MYSIKEKTIKLLFTLFAFASLLFLIGIVVVLFKESIPVIYEIKVFDFIFGKE